MAKRTRTTAGLALLAILGGFTSVAGAQDLDMQGTSGMQADDGRPTRGMSQTSVESTYGAPVSRRDAVGDPPITRWEYENFVVFFEYDRVIHAVRKR